MWFLFVEALEFCIVLDRMPKVIALEEWKSKYHIEIDLQEMPWESRK